MTSEEVLELTLLLLKASKGTPICFQVKEWVAPDHSRLIANFNYFRSSRGRCS